MVPVPEEEEMKKKVTCAYCGRQRPVSKMTESMLMRGKLICRSEVTICLKIRAGTIHDRNALRE